MDTTRVENLPAPWDDARDCAFFRIVDSVFTATFCMGASVLLASYDDVGLSVEGPSGAAASAKTDPRVQPATDLISVRVRRSR